MTYNIDETYFEEIDTEEKAYWLGFIWGDGYTQYRENKNSYVFKMDLSTVDEYHLEKFKKSLGCNKKILRYSIKSQLNSFFYSRFTTYKKVFIKILRDKYGITAKRSDFSKVIDNTPYHLHSHLLRGLFDADGSIVSRAIKYKKCNRLEWSISLIGSDSVLDWYNNLLIENNITKTIYKRSIRHKGKDENMSTIIITGNNIVKNVLNFMYNDSKVNLDRKYKKYLELKEYIKQYNMEVK